MLTLADGRTLAYTELGDPDGYPVLWCHGGLSSRIDIELASDGLAGASVRMISPDRPGIGESDRRPGRRVSDWPQDVVALADHLELERFAVAGWSAGGPFALACAAALPERVSAVATIGGMAPVRSRSERRELGLATDRMLIPLTQRVPWLAGAVLGVTARMKPERLKARVVKVLPRPDQEILAPLPAARAVGYSVAALAHGTHGTVDDYRAFGGDWGFDPAAVTTPVRCWQGTDDTLVPMGHARRIAAALPAGTLQEVAAAGHFLFVTHTSEVFRRLREDAGA